MGTPLTPLVLRRAAETNMQGVCLAFKCWTIINIFDVLLWALWVLCLSGSSHYCVPGASTSTERARTSALCSASSNSPRNLSFGMFFGRKEVFPIVLQLLSHCYAATFPGFSFSRFMLKGINGEQLGKAPEEIQLPVRNIFTEHELVHFWVVWSAHEWQKIQTCCHIFSLCPNQAT